jgi:hypothetical protein
MTCNSLAQFLTTEAGKNSPSVFWTKQSIFLPIFDLRTHKKQYTQLKKLTCPLKVAKNQSKDEKSTQDPM